MTESKSEALARDIEILAELFKAGGWREIRVESVGVSLLLSTDRTAPSFGGVRSTVQPAPAPAAVALSTAPSGPAPAVPKVIGSIDPDWVVVAAPNLGTFYRSPKPGAAPFVEVGQKVIATTEICLIEVMKLFTSVQAGVAGTVRHIAVADAELVEGGQALIYIEHD
jgi:acetyl-CoA carboxylase biotin carboxyl carrier protein